MADVVVDPEAESVTIDILETERFRQMIVVIAITEVNGIIGMSESIVDLIITADPRAKLKIRVAFTRLNRIALWTDPENHPTSLLSRRLPLRWFE
jgi:hypothetical protein